MNNIANLSTIFMNFQGAINGLRADFETVKTELNRVNQELASLKETKTQEVPQVVQSQPEVNYDEALESVKRYVNEQLEAQTTHSTKRFNELAEENKKVVASLSDFNNAVTGVVSSVSDLNKVITSTSSSLNNLSARVTAVETRHTLSIDDVKGLIDASLAMLIANLSGPVPVSNEITAAPEVSAPLASIPETDAQEEEHELEQPAEETPEAHETLESTIPTTDAVEAVQATAPVKRGGRGRGRGKKSA
jgi:chromosome segregation ATPase